MTTLTRFFALGAFLASAAHSAEIQVVISGKYQGTIRAYQIGTTYYLGAQEAGSVYGGQVFWFPVAGRVQMSLHGRQIRFLVNSDQAQAGTQTIPLSHPVITRTSRAYIPLDFFLSRDFSDLAEMDSQFNAGTQLLAVDRRTTVGPVRWFGYENFTRIEVELGKTMSYTASRRGRGGFEVAFPFGQTGGSQTVSVLDGTVDEIKLKQEPKAARLAVRLGNQAVSWDKTEEQKPRRLVFNIYRNEKAAHTGAAKLAQQEKMNSSFASDKTEAFTATPSTEPAEPDIKSATAPFAAASPVSAPATAVSSSAAPAPKPAPPTPPAPEKNARRPRIVIDAGHGGKDSGAKGRHHVIEKEINLIAAKEFAALLEQEGMFDVLLIRDDDTFVPLDERSRRANEYHPDLFVSLHCNAADRKRENGFEIYFLSEQASDPESQRVAAMENSVLRMEGRTPEEDAAADVLHAMAKTEYINDSSEAAGLMSDELSKRAHLFNRGVKQAAFYVLRGTYAPAVLVEMGFVTNSRDAADLQSKKFRRKLLEGLYAGILDFGRFKNWNLK